MAGHRPGVDRRPRDPRARSHEPLQRVTPALLQLLERLHVGRLDVLPGGFVGLPDLGQPLPGLLGLRFQLLQGFAGVGPALSPACFSAS